MIFIIRTDSGCTRAACFLCAESRAQPEKTGRAAFLNRETDLSNALRNAVKDFMQSYKNMNAD